MKVKDIFNNCSSIIDEDTEIVIRDSDMQLMARGNWFNDDVLDSLDHEAESFTWQDDNKFFIDLK